MFVLHDNVKFCVYLFIDIVFFHCCLVCRSRMAIIPQDPFLFDSSIRENIDPFSVVTIFFLLASHVVL